MSPPPRKAAAHKGTSRKKAPAKAWRRPPRKRVEAVVSLLTEHDPHPECALTHANPFELVAATILSAQCTDVRVNMVTPALFARYPDPASMAAAELEDLQELVRTTGFFRNKAKSLKGMAATLVSDFGGEVPRTMEELLTLPGVARKTANVVLGTCFGEAQGVVVDTHVARITGRLRFTPHTDPVKIERDLMALLPESEWIDFSHRIIRFGRTVCDARKPRCDDCFLRPHCPRVGVDAASAKSSRARGSSRAGRPDKASGAS